MRCDRLFASVGAVNMKRIETINQTNKIKQTTRGELSSKKHIQVECNDNCMYWLKNDCFIFTRIIFKVNGETKGERERDREIERENGGKKQKNKDPAPLIACSTIHPTFQTNLSKYSTNKEVVLWFCCN